MSKDITIKYWIYGKLNGQRRRFDREYAELYICKLYVNDFKKKMDQGGHTICMINGLIKKEIPLDKKWFDFLGVEIIDPQKRMMELLNCEAEAEYNFRKKAIRDYIKKRGLENKTEEIIDGMNLTCGRITIGNDFQARNAWNIRNVIHHDGNALLNFAFNYIEKWKKYNALFGK